MARHDPPVREHRAPDDQHRRVERELERHRASRGVQREPSPELRVERGRGGASQPRGERRLAEPARRRVAEVAADVEGLVVAVEHVDGAALLAGLRVELAEEHDDAFFVFEVFERGKKVRKKRRFSSKISRGKIILAPFSLHRQLSLLPISLSPRSSTSPSCTTTVSPPHQAGRARSSCESTPASSSDAIALPRSPWMSPTLEFFFFRFLFFF